MIHFALAGVVSGLAGLVLAKWPSGKSAYWAYLDAFPAVFAAFFHFLAGGP
jgi:hypothetical protein